MKTVETDVEFKNSTDSTEGIKEVLEKDLSTIISSTKESTETSKVLGTSEPTKSSTLETHSESEKVTSEAPVAKDLIDQGFSEEVPTVDGHKHSQTLVPTTDEGTKESSNTNSLTVNKRFVVNTLKQVDDHNRYRINQNSKLLRKFQNEERKKHTIKNLQKFSPQKTLYSDFFDVSLACKKKGKEGRTKIITPLEQVKKFISETPVNKLDKGNEQEDMSRVVKKSRFCIDKTLLNNHLKHYSVHNRLREERGMWDKYDSPSSKSDKKVPGIQTKSSKLSRGKIGGMYADREPGNVKTTKIKDIPDDAPSFGSATQELLELEESMPDRWGHSGFKEIYVDKSDTLVKKKHMKSHSSRKVVIANDITARLNNSIELSDDDEVRIVPASKKHSNKKMAMVSRSVMINEEPECSNRTAVPKKRSIVTVVSKANKINKDDNKSISKRLKLGTLQADLILDEKNKQKMSRRAQSPKWGHDGFKRIMHKRSRLDVDSSSGDDDNAVDKRDTHKNLDKSPNHKKNMKQKESSSDLTDSDEWTEKEVDDGLAKNDARRKLKQNNNSNKRLGEKNGKSSVKSRIGKRKATSDDSDSSFTDSSSDERYKREIYNRRNDIPRKKSYNDHR